MMNHEDERRYTDIGIQTSPFMSSQGASSINAGSSTLTAGSLSIPSLAPSEGIPPEILPERKNYIPTNKHALSSDSPKHRRLLPLLPSFPSTFELQRYTPGSRLNFSGNRTVSLPEPLYDEDLCLALSQLMDSSVPEVREQPRVVSMPEAVQLHRQYGASATDYGYHEPEAPSLEAATYDLIHRAGGEDLDSNSSTPSTPGTIVMHSVSSDPYHTPSPPPSSCDSIEFTLEDPVHLPDGFLRGPTSDSPPVFIPAATNKGVGLLEDDGWLTWANSPPRPIPALHGPSSLPYARCPSGAEGTIIGEPSSLPRMIWGLDPNDAVSTSHVPQPQQSRPASTKLPASNLKSRYSAHQGSASFVKPATFSSPHVGPRFSNSDVNYNPFEQPQSGKVFSRPVSTAPEAHREEGPRSNERKTIRGEPAPGIDLSVHEDPMRHERRYEHGVRDNDIMKCSHLLGNLAAPNTVDRFLELLPVEETQHQRQPDNRTQEETYREHSYRSGSRKGHQSNLIDLLASPVSLFDHAPNVYSRVASGTPRLSTQEFIPSYLPTPPSSTSPQWSSVFSPMRGSRGLSAGFSSYSSNDHSSGIAMRKQTNTTNNELSEELRRFVFENMSPISSANTLDALQASRTSHACVTNVCLQARNAPSGSESPAHPPGLPIPQHILLSKALEPFDPLSAHAPSPRSAISPSTSPYARSTLANPRSIPLSRLRQKRGAIKLATVPEEDSADSYVHDGRLAPLMHSPFRLFLRTPSPLDDRLHAQSMEEKTTPGDDLKLRQARVKLPHGANTHAGSTQGGYFDLCQNATLQDSPKKKRLQRRKRPVKLAENGKTGFPLVSEGTVSFGSCTSSVPQDVRKGGDPISSASARLTTRSETKIPT